MLDALSHGYKSIHNIAEGCGISTVPFHHLRYPHVSLMLTSNIPIRVLQARMAHERIESTVNT